MLVSAMNGTEATTSGLQVRLKQNMYKRIKLFSMGSN